MPRLIIRNGDFATRPGDRDPLPGLRHHPVVQTALATFCIGLVLTGCTRQDNLPDLKGLGGQHISADTSGNLTFGDVSYSAMHVTDSLAVIELPLNAQDNHIHFDAHAWEVMTSFNAPYIQLSDLGGSDTLDLTASLPHHIDKIRLLEAGSSGSIALELSNGHERYRIELKDGIEKVSIGGVSFHVAKMQQNRDHYNKSNALQYALNGHIESQGIDVKQAKADHATQAYVNACVALNAGFFGESPEECDQKARAEISRSIATLGLEKAWQRIDEYRQSAARMQAYVELYARRAQMRGDEGTPQDWKQAAVNHFIMHIEHFPKLPEESKEIQNDIAKLQPPYLLRMNKALTDLNLVEANEQNSEKAIKKAYQDRPEQMAADVELGEAQLRLVDATLGLMAMTGELKIVPEAAAGELTPEAQRQALRDAAAQDSKVQNALQKMLTPRKGITKDSPEQQARALEAIADTYEKYQMFAALFIYEQTKASPDGTPPTPEKVAQAIDGLDKQREAARNQSGQFPAGTADPLHTAIENAIQRLQEQSRQAGDTTNALSDKIREILKNGEGTQNSGMKR